MVILMVGCINSFYSCKVQLETDYLLSQAHLLCFFYPQFYSIVLNADLTYLSFDFKTHPSQTCFMSSVDLHTHYSYQVIYGSIFITMAQARNIALIWIFSVIYIMGAIGLIFLFEVFIFFIFWYYQILKFFYPNIQLATTSNISAFRFYVFSWYGAYFVVSF